MMDSIKLQQTPSQTIGPFFAYSLTAEQYGYDYNSILNGSLLGDDATDEHIYITGKIFDGNDSPISDAMVEIWQSDANGNYVTQYPPPWSLLSRAYGRAGNTPISFKGFGRSGTGTEDDKSFIFKTIKPGALADESPHINVILFMRGSLHALYTRIYFDDEQNDNDPLYKIIDAERRKTLIAQRKERDGKIVYQFNIYMQGKNETVFFDVH